MISIYLERSNCHLVCFSKMACAMCDRLREHECSWYNIKCLEKALSLYFPSPAFRRNGAVQYNLPQFRSTAPSQSSSFLKKDAEEDMHCTSASVLQNGTMSSSPSNEVERLQQMEIEEENSEDSDDSSGVNYFVLPWRVSDESIRLQHESYTSMLRQFRDQVLSMPRRPYARPITERDWLRNAARIWDLIKKSPVIADYGRTLQNSGLYRR